MAANVGFGWRYEGDGGPTLESLRAAIEHASDKYNRIPIQISVARKEAPAFDDVDGVPVVVVDSTQPGHVHVVLQQEEGGRLVQRMNL